ncbi:MAG: hypothetical protein E6K94_10635 [Thaumarchaeota archaeon]|nr:MAG: hypothetical protein E6L03_09585 [Nitrososphaerota archaeon]TLX89287.1 MAG: hypothetical protein E6K94_10635 [Nitrososphaerota archaeon]
MNDRKIILGVIIMITLGTTLGATAPMLLQQAYALRESFPEAFSNKAPVAISGDNIYVAWWTNKTGNDEVMFRASTDAGKTFSDKINLSNTTDAESRDAEIAADRMNVVVTWWERNQTSNEPVLKISTDGGKTFGPMLKLATNGTLGTGEAKPLLP